QSRPIDRTAAPSVYRVFGDDWRRQLLLHAAGAWRRWGHSRLGAPRKPMLSGPSYERMLANDHRGARHIWSTLETLVPLLFREANPMPIKYCLWSQGLLHSPEYRLPLTRVSSKLAYELDRAMGIGGVPLADE